MLVKTFCAEVMGLEATTITIEVNMTRGVMFHLSGLADTAVKESYDRIRAAITNIGLKPPTAELTINLSPADIRKEGSGYDLPLAIGILAAHSKVSDGMLSDYMMIGELGLDGKLKPVNGILPVAILASLLPSHSTCMKSTSTKCRDSERSTRWRRLGLLRFGQFLGSH